MEICVQPFEGHPTPPTDTFVSVRVDGVQKQAPITERSEWLFPSTTSVSGADKHARMEVFQGLGYIDLDFLSLLNGDTQELILSKSDCLSHDFSLYLTATPADEAVFAMGTTKESWKRKEAACRRYLRKHQVQEHLEDAVRGAVTGRPQERKGSKESACSPEGDQSPKLGATLNGQSDRANRGKMTVCFCVDLVTDEEEVPADVFLSVSVGNVLKQSRLSPSKTWRLPVRADRQGKPLPTRGELKVMKRIGDSLVNLGYGSQDVSVSPDLGFHVAVKGGDNSLAPSKKAPPAVLKKKDVGFEILKKHNMQAFLHNNVKSILQERPATPESIIDGWFARKGLLPPLDAGEVRSASKASEASAYRLTPQPPVRSRPTSAVRLKPLSRQGSKSTAMLLDLGEAAKSRPSSKAPSTATKSQSLAPNIISAARRLKAKKELMEVQERAATMEANLTDLTSKLEVTQQAAQTAEEGWQDAEERVRKAQEEVQAVSERAHEGELEKERALEQASAVLAAAQAEARAAEDAAKAYKQQLADREQEEQELRAAFEKAAMEKAAQAARVEAEERVRKAEEEVKAVSSRAHEGELEKQRALEEAASTLAAAQAQADEAAQAAEVYRQELAKKQQEQEQLRAALEKEALEKAAQARQEAEERVRKAEEEVKAVNGKAHESEVAQQHALEEASAILAAARAEAKAAEEAAEAYKQQLAKKKQEEEELRASLEKEAAEKAIKAAQEEAEERMRKAEEEASAMSALAQEGNELQKQQAEEAAAAILAAARAEAQAIEEAAQGYREEVVARENEESRARAEAENQAVEKAKAAQAAAEQAMEDARTRADEQLRKAEEEAKAVKERAKAGSELEKQQAQEAASAILTAARAEAAAAARKEAEERMRKAEEEANALKEKALAGSEQEKQQAHEAAAEILAAARAEAAETARKEAEERMRKAEEEAHAMSSRAHAGSELEKQQAHEAAEAILAAARAEAQAIEQAAQNYKEELIANESEEHAKPKMDEDESEAVVKAKAAQAAAEQANRKLEAELSQTRRALEEEKQRAKEREEQDELAKLREELAKAKLALTEEKQRADSLAAAVKDQDNAASVPSATSRQTSPETAAQPAVAKVRSGKTSQALLDPTEASALKVFATKREDGVRAEPAPGRGTLEDSALKLSHFNSPISSGPAEAFSHRPPAARDAKPKASGEESSTPALQVIAEEPTREWVQRTEAQPRPVKLGFAHRPSVATWMSRPPKFKPIKERKPYVPSPAVRSFYAELARKQQEVLLRKRAEKTLQKEAEQVAELFGEERAWAQAIELVNTVAVQKAMEEAAELEMSQSASTFRASATGGPFKASDVTALPPVAEDEEVLEPLSEEECLQRLEASRMEAEDLASKCEAEASKREVALKSLETMQAKPEAEPQEQVRWREELEKSDKEVRSLIDQERRARNRAQKDQWKWEERREELLLEGVQVMMTSDQQDSKPMKRPWSAKSMATEAWRELIEASNDIEACKPAEQTLRLSMMRQLEDELDDMQSLAVSARAAGDPAASHWEETAQLLVATLENVREEYKAAERRPRVEVYTERDLRRMSEFSGSDHSLLE